MDKTILVSRACMVATLSLTHTHTHTHTHTRRIFPPAKTKVGKNFFRHVDNVKHEYQGDSHISFKK